MLEYIIPAAASLIGGFMNRESTKDANQANLANQNAINAQNIALQKEFAQNGIKWKVEDAKNAGLHPLAALGAQTTSFSPISVGASFQSDTGAGQGFSDMGQNIGRALNATRTQAEREANTAATLASQAERQAAADHMAMEKHWMAMDNMYLQNQLLASKLHHENFVGPPMPDAAGPSGNGGGAGRGTRYNSYQFQPSKITSADRNSPDRTAGPPSPGFKPYRTAMGTIEIPSNEMAESLEGVGEFIKPFVFAGHSVAKAFRNWNEGYGTQKPASGPGYDWEWSRYHQGWQAVKK